MAQDRFYIARANWTERGVTLNGWKVWDRVNRKPAKGTKGAGSATGGYAHRVDAQNTADNLNKADREVQKAQAKKKREDKRK